MSLAEACGVLQIHRNTAYKLIEAGELVPLPTFKLGKKRYRFGVAYIDSLMPQYGQIPKSE